MSDTPASLLERLRDPKADEAWGRFVELYSPLLLYWARRVGLREPDASDLVQEVFVVLLRKLPEFQYDARKGFRSWLRTVTLNRWREIRRQRHHATVGADGLDDIPDIANSWRGAFSK
jgi:RNA polymerase sigma-70 factor, ECF subfamily